MQKIKEAKKECTQTDMNKYTYIMKQYNLIYVIPYQITGIFPSYIGIKNP